MFCKLCGENNKLVKAHIIPESFWKHLQVPGKVAKLLARNSYPIRVPVGVYDSKILCGECEKKFSDWDSYGKGFLIDSFDKSAIPYPDRDDVLAYIIKNYDYDKLKLFFLSVLFRASVSKENFFSNVDIGTKHEETLKKAICNRQPLGPGFFSVILGTFSGVMPNPQRKKLSNVNGYYFFLHNFRFFIKVDQREISGFWHDFILKPEKELIIIPQDISQKIQHEDISKNLLMQLKQNGYMK